MKSILFIFVSLTGLGVNAGTSLSNKSITSLISYDDYALIKFTPSDSATNCQKINYVHVDLSNGKGKAIYSAALTAATAKKEVRLKINEGDCDTVWQAAKLYQIDVTFSD